MYSGLVRIQGAEILFIKIVSSLVENLIIENNRKSNTKMHYACAHVHLFCICITVGLIYGLVNY